MPRAYTLGIDPNRRGMKNVKLKSMVAILTLGALSFSAHAETTGEFVTSFKCTDGFCEFAFDVNEDNKLSISRAFVRDQKSDELVVMTPARLAQAQKYTLTREIYPHDFSALAKFSAAVMKLNLDECSGSELKFSIYREVKARPTHNSPLGDNTYQITFTAKGLQAPTARMELAIQPLGDLTQKEFLELSNGSPAGDKTLNAIIEKLKQTCSAIRVERNQAQPSLNSVIGVH